MLQDVLLEGQRALLRPLAASDADAAFGMLAGRREILDWLEWSGPTERADLDPVYGNWRRGDELGHDYHFAIVDRADGQFAGGLSLSFRGHAGCGDLGFWVAAERWGRGLASDAVGLAAWLCFEHLASTLLSARVFVGNQASRRVLEKVGFREEHRSRILIDGVSREQWHLSLMRSGCVAHGPQGEAAARVELLS